MSDLVCKCCKGKMMGQRGGWGVGGGKGFLLLSLEEVQQCCSLHSPVCMCCVCVLCACVCVYVCMCVLCVQASV